MSNLELASNPDLTPAQFKALLDLEDEFVYEALDLNDSAAERYMAYLVRTIMRLMSRVMMRHIFGLEKLVLRALPCLSDNLDSCIKSREILSVRLFGMA